MKIEQEKEIKYKLTKEEYELLVKEISSSSNFLGYNIKEKSILNIEDTYYDDYKRSLKNNNSVLRIRKDQNSINLILKIKQEDKTSIEKIKKLTENESSNFNELYSELVEDFNINIKDILVIAKYKFERNSFSFENFKIDIDKVYFLDNKVDYEIEIEDISLIEAKKKLKKIEEKYNIKLNKSIPKIARYFENMNKENMNKEDEKLEIENIIVVVEGKSDTNKLKKVYKNIMTFETNGLGITPHMIEELKKISKNNNRKIVVLTDPDVPGEIIRNIIKEQIPSAYHVHISKEKANNKNKVGIEHCKEKDLKNIFNNYQKYNDNNNKYTIDDLIKLGIYANKKKRIEFCKKYNIAYGNNKKVLKQLNEYNINIIFPKTPHL